MTRIKAATPPNPLGSMIKAGSFAYASLLLIALAAAFLFHRADGLEAGNGGDSTPPSVVSISTHGVLARNIRVNYNEPLAPTSAPEPGAYQVTVDGETQAIQKIALGEALVRIKLFAHPKHGTTVLLSYDPADGTALTDSAGNPAPAFENAKVETSPVTPEPPENLAARLDGRTLSVSWDPPQNDGGTPVFEYVIQWRSEGQEYRWDRQTATADTSQRITGLGEGTNYHIRVSAINARGESTQATETTIRIPDQTPPKVTEATLNDNSVTITYSETLATNQGNQLASSFSSSNGEITGTGITDDRITLTLTGRQEGQATLTVGYHGPEQVIRDGQGNPAPFFDGLKAPPEGPPGKPGNVRTTLREPGQVTLSWQAPSRTGGRPVLSHTVQWKADGEEYEASRQAEIPHWKSSHTVAGLTQGADYTFRVWANNVHGAGEAVETRETPAGFPGMLRHTVAQELAERHEHTHPWLMKTWQHIQENPEFSFEQKPPSAPLFAQAEIDLDCRTDTQGLEHCRAGRIAVAQGYQNNTGILSHELAHFYTLASDLPYNPEATVAAFMYFESIQCGYASGELMADVMALSIDTGMLTGYWRKCDGDFKHYGTSRNTRQAFAVVESALQGEIPRWFTEHYSDENGNTDMEKLWAGIKNIERDDQRRRAVYHMKDAHGGYCNPRLTADEVNNRETGTLTNPWKESGCMPGVPQNVRAEATVGGVTISWTAPKSQGGAPVTGFSIEWRNDGQEFDDSRRDRVPTEGNSTGEFTHTINRPTDGQDYSVRVLASNALGESPPSTEVTGTPRETTPPQKIRARVDGETLRVLYNEALDENSAPPANAYDVRVVKRGSSESWQDEKARRGVDGVSINGNSVILTLTSAVTSEDYVVISYAPPSNRDSSRVRDSAGNAAAGFKPTEAFNDTEEAPAGAAEPEEPDQNSSPTGEPTISGTVRVGETLTASTSDIADADGLDNVSFSYQWIRPEGGTDTDIAGETAQTYELSGDDVGKTIQVRVTFTDNADNEESLTSAATGVVAPRPPLTASFQGQPSSHDGQADFTFELHFSEEVPVSYLTLRDHAFTVTGGTVIKAQRLTQGSNLGWRITVTPDSSADVAVLLPVTTGCDASGAICTGDGRKLSNRHEFTVSGP